ncbi:ion channel [Acetobacter orientalis]|uniref:ion channel n=1 Tax=Acetobacter orientalis TaxID=146474 RepID=UPI0020A44517|nr:ion channel [Acetobacter orientalis]
MTIDKPHLKSNTEEGFLKLPDVKDEINCDHDLIKLLSESTTINRKLYIPFHLKSSYSPWPHIIKNVTFCEVSFSRTEVELFEFTDCVFERCLFLGTIFLNCRFSSCRFVDCNPYRVQFIGCFVDPTQFDQCLPKGRSANLGLHLFQQLLLNSRQQVQPDFSDEAQFRFRRWQHRQLRAELTANFFTRRSWKRAPQYLLAVLFDIAAGSGMRLGRLLLSSTVFLLSTTVVNWQFAHYLGLNDEKGVIDAFYLTTVIMTTLGFGDVTPHTEPGRFIVSGEAVCGFFLFAFLTSTLYRRLSP